LKSLSNQVPGIGFLPEIRRRLVTKAVIRTSSPDYHEGAPTLIAGGVVGFRVIVLSPVSSGTVADEAEVPGALPEASDLDFLFVESRELFETRGTVSISRG
jgi:hypothetical protein